MTIGAAMTPNMADLAITQTQQQLGARHIQHAADASGKQSRLSQEQARKVADDFEAVFLSQMLAHMSADVKLEAPFGGGPGEDMFRSLLNNEYAKAISSRGGIGVSDQIYRQILALQEV